MKFNLSSAVVIIGLFSGTAFSSVALAEKIDADDLVFSGPAPVVMGETYDFKENVIKKEYPKHWFNLQAKFATNTFVSELPQINGVTAANRFSASEFSDKSPSIGRYTLDYEYASSNSSYIRVEFTKQTYGVGKSISGGARGLKVNESQIDIYHFRVAPSAYCYVWYNGDQLCGGYQVSYDQIPTLRFDRNSTGSNQYWITNLKDVEAGLHISYANDFAENFKLNVIAYYDYGLGIQQNSLFALKGGTTVVTGLVNVSYLMSAVTFTAGAEIESTQAKISNSVDSWSVKSDSPEDQS
jgi:hypothetical protein